ncbi:MAG: carbonic anhydrase family protein [Ignavibacteriae bacterium]|nr:carbonic anhydrase family protein [Ignavibacteriota bacterium]
MKIIKSYALVLILTVLLASCGQKKTETNASYITETKVKKHEHTVINTSEDALNELKNGNKRFTEGKLENTDYKEQVENTKTGQNPHSVILSCLDSRVPPEIIFDQGFGNIFVARVAGNVEDANILGSLEYATKIVKSKLIVVMGHNDCGAIKGAVDNAELGNLSQLVEQIKPAITGDKSNLYKMLDETSKKNVKLTIENILKNSEVIAGLVKEGKVKIVGAYYDVSTGKVEFLN